MKCRSTNKAVCSAKYHVIWCPKYRRRVIGGRVETWFKQVIHEVVAEAGGQVIELETIPDHVHLLMLWSPPPQETRAGGPPLWFVFTVGGAPLEVVRRYVENQKLAG